MATYTIRAYRGDEGENPSYEESTTSLREARSRAWRLAHRVRPAGVTARPVWVEGGTAWNDRTVVGGYDAGGDMCPGSACAVVHREDR